MCEVTSTLVVIVSCTKLIIVYKEPLFSVTIIRIIDLSLFNV